MMFAQIMMAMSWEDHSCSCLYTCKRDVVAWLRVLLDRPVTEMLACGTAGFAHAGGAGSKDKKKETKLGLTAKKAENFPDWYTEVVREAELISYYTVSGQKPLISHHVRPLSMVLPALASLH